MDKIIIWKTQSYLKTATESTGLLEARGPETFAFVHQTFQEYLAANRLAIPTRRAVKRILDVANEPRWHEVIRLAAGVIGVYQRDLDAMEELIDALLAENDDPLEPFLCVRLRLAAACIADDVGFRQRDINRVMSRIAERLLHLPARWPITAALAEALRVLPLTQPERVSDEVIDFLCDLAGHPGWEPRMEATRKLGDVADRSATARQKLETLLQDKDTDVQAHAAVGLWQAGHELQPLVSHIAYGITSLAAKITPKLPPDGVRNLLLLLEAEDADARWMAVLVLGKWGHQAEVLPVLLELLEADSADVRLSVAAVLGNWGHQAEASPVLLDLLKAESASVRLRAAQILGDWGPQAEVLPALLQWLEAEDADAHWMAILVLGKWNPQAEALPSLLDLLEAEDANVRWNTAKVLGNWGHQAEASPVLLDLLEAEDAHVRWNAVEVLGSWGYQAEVLPALLALLKAESAYVRWNASEALGNWGHFKPRRCPSCWTCSKLRMPMFA